MHDVEAREGVLASHQYVITTSSNHQPLGDDDLPVSLIEAACLSATYTVATGLRTRAFYFPLPTSSTTAFQSTFGLWQPPAGSETYAEVTLLFGFASASSLCVGID